MRRAGWLTACAVWAAHAAAPAGAVPASAPRREVPAGWYRNPFQSALVKDSTAIARFRLDERAVTVSEYLRFTRAHPEWARSRVKRVFADSQYLKSWKSDAEPPADRLSDPVTEVSWFAAKAYCEAAGGRLPATAEWEYAAGTLPPGADSASRAQSILDWYAHPAAAGRVPAAGSRDAFGLRDLHGRIWEWTYDFNSAVPLGTLGKAACGSGQASALGADYATYMRFSFRTSLKAAYSVGSLGFRCAEGGAP